MITDYAGDHDLEHHVEYAATKKPYHMTQGTPLNSITSWASILNLVRTSCRCSNKSNVNTLQMK